MPSEPDKKTDMLLKRLREEIIPVFEKAFKNSDVCFPNSHIVECRKALDCKYTDCQLYSNISGPVRCWQISDTYCSGKPQGSFVQKYHECRKCKVFKDSCPTVIEEVGELLNNLFFLLKERKQTAIEDQQRIEHLKQELSSVLEQLNKKEKEIKEIMITDKLTTLYNRQHLITVLESEISRCQRYGRPLAVIFMDIDGFKGFNDTYGHQVGDKMLSSAGSLIKENTRNFDRAFRYSGEEFVVVLPETDLTMAYFVAERIRKGFENTSFSVSKKESGSRESTSCTMSVGITATFAYGTENISIEDLINQTEKALQQAKERGGNICVRFVKD